MVDDQMVDNDVATDEAPVADHPQAGVSEEGWSSPVGECHLAKLVVKRSGAETDVEFHVNPPCIIGRFDPAVGPIDIDLGTLPEGSYVSRKHAKITCDDGVWKIADMGSSNGTFLLRQDFEKVDEAELNDGDEIALGNARFVFHYVQTEPAEASA
jgi:pSer/pThr/pTyr-binding forkhead associated (FHA) protein